MKYENVIERLMSRFPELKDKYEADKDYYESLPYVVYEGFFVPYIVKACRNLDIVKINEISAFLEEMIQSENDRVNTLVGVAVIESLMYEEEAPLKVLRKYLKKETLKELVSMENWKPTYGR